MSTPTPLMPKHRRWIAIVGITGFVISTSAAAVERNYVLVLQNALGGTLVWLLVRGYPPAERLAARLLCWIVLAGFVTVLIYRVLVAFSKAT